MRIVGLIATYNEELVIAAFLEHHIAQGLGLYLIDNGSTDRTVEIARSFLGRGLIGLESMPRRGEFDLRRLLARKEELALGLSADWFLHLDADEIRLAPEDGRTLALAIREADAAGFNAINFMEFTFLPTLEAPDHAHPRFRETMRWYYPYWPEPLNRVNGWKKQPRRVNLTGQAGHRVRFPGQYIYPIPFRMLHYQFLSVAHAEQKYSRRRHAARALARGWHGWREQLAPASVRLPSWAELHELGPDGRLDLSRPRARHFLDNRPERPGPSGSNPGGPEVAGPLATCQRLLGRVAAWVFRRLGRSSRR